jgi:hypothetical protein
LAARKTTPASRLRHPRTHGIGIQCPDCLAFCEPSWRSQDKAGWWQGTFDCPLCDDTMFQAAWFPDEGNYTVTRTL